jgi:beta-glucanase (GH16 family)
VYGLERKGNAISLFVDDNVYFTFTPPASALSQIFEKPMYLLINTAVGGSWGGAVDDSIFPQKFYVDYVRVYRLR